MTTTTITRYRFLGVTDECVQCQNCGKPNLRSTVVLSILDTEGNDVGDVTYYGSSCAARALGQTGCGAARDVLGKARAAHRRLVLDAYDARSMLAHYGLPETGEPTTEQVTAAMQRYIRAHRNVFQWVQETGVGVRARVLEMLARYQAVLADAARLKVSIPADEKALLTFVSSF